MSAERNLTAHQLARKLLEGPDLPVVYPDFDEGGAVMDYLPIEELKRHTHEVTGETYVVIG